MTPKPMPLSLALEEEAATAGSSAPRVPVIGRRRQAFADAAC